MSIAARLLLLAMLGLLHGLPAHAGDFCVDSVAELVQAIGQFEDADDGEVVSIKVVQGTYVVNDLLGDHNYGSGGREVGLKILGGYTAGCASRTLNPTNTVIDGNNRPDSSFVVVLADDAAAYIEGLTFTRMVTDPDDASAALTLITAQGSGDASYAAVRHCRFLRNSVPYAVWISAAQIRFVNNLVVDNTLLVDTVFNASSAVWITYDEDADSGAAITNNTIADNHGGAGLRLRSDNEPSARNSEIANNILWGNDGADLHLLQFNSAANVLFVNSNIVADSAGTVPAGAGNINSNPQFINAPALNYALALSSPAINSGVGAQYYGIPDRDLIGNDRVIGSRIDRGAFESSVNDATTAFVTTTLDNGNNTTPTAGSLRAAIKAANSASGPYEIKFAIPGTCPRVINLTNTMLDITGKVSIDARTQNGWSANTAYGGFDASLCVVLNGSGNAHAFRVPSLAPNASLTVFGMMFAGFSDAAIRLENGSNHRIAGNQFGAVPFTDDNGTAVRVTGASGGAFIGGYDDPGAINLIAGSNDAGIYLDNSSGGSTVANNVIGFQPDGATPSGNQSGVFILNSPANNLQYNYIGHSGSAGVTLSGIGSSGNLLQYNFIGVNRAYALAGNQGAGVTVTSSARNNTIGAPILSSFGRNLIFGNTGPGVWISSTGGADNRVLANHFDDNGGIDIDLGAAGPTANVATNPGTGPNLQQNHPLLAQATRIGGATPSVQISGTLHSAPNNYYRIDVYAGSDCDSSPPGRGAAQFHLGSEGVDSNAAGDVNLQLTFAADPLASYDQITATATSATGNTSEIGNCIPLVPGNLPQQVFRDGFEQ